MVSSIPPPPLLPIGHIVLMITGVISLLVYIIIITVIIRHRKQIVALQSPFYSLLIMQSFLDMVTYLAIETLVRPRKYRYFSFFENDPNGIWPYICYHIMSLRESVVLGKIILAFNRLSIFYDLKVQELWSKGTVICWFLVQCSASFLLTCYLHFTSKDNSIVFQVNPAGILRLATSEDINEKETSSIFIGSLFASSSSLIMYALAFYYSRKQQHGYNRLIERKLLFFSVWSSVPMFLEMIRILYQRNLSPVTQPIQFVNINDFWFYTVQLMTMGQPWIILISNGTVRNLFFNGILHGKWTDQTMGKVRELSHAALFLARKRSITKTGNGRTV